MLAILKHSICNCHASSDGSVVDDGDCFENVCRICAKEKSKQHRSAMEAKVARKLRHLQNSVVYARKEKTAAENFMVN
jgi:hypothetical protein